MARGPIQIFLSGFVRQAELAHIINIDSIVRLLKYGQDGYSETVGSDMSKKGPKKLLELKENVSFVHLNVRSGYISYIEKPSEESKPCVKGKFLHKKRPKPNSQ